MLIFFQRNDFSKKFKKLYFNCNIKINQAKQALNLSMI